ncbi:MAG TPA: biotin/lipoyl-containing protein [Steroidobacteraceae bacterium]|nr:biotin/lipoyl-containing protein [Steroidobacteraceae bacterium]
MPGPIVISVPDLGDFRDVEVIEVLVAPGDRVELETPLITLETDKATMDIPATAAGTVLELQVKKGDRVSMGDAVLVLEPGEAAAARVTAQPAAQEQAREASPEARPAGDSRDVGLRVPDLGDFHDVEVIEVLVSRTRAPGRRSRLLHCRAARLPILPRPLDASLRPTASTAP